MRLTNVCATFPTISDLSAFVKIQLNTTLALHLPPLHIGTTTHALQTWHVTTFVQYSGHPLITEHY
jgi:hypothetical protein